MSEFISNVVAHIKMYKKLLNNMDSYNFKRLYHSIVNVDSYKNILNNVDSNNCKVFAILQ